MKLAYSSTFYLDALFPNGGFAIRPFLLLDFAATFWLSRNWGRVKHVHIGTSLTCSPFLSHGSMTWHSQLTILSCPLRNYGITLLASP